MLIMQCNVIIDRRQCSGVSDRTSKKGLVERHHQVEQCSQSLHPNCDSQIFLFGRLLLFIPDIDVSRATCIRKLSSLKN